MSRRPAGRPAAFAATGPGPQTASCRLLTCHAWNGGPPLLYECARLPLRFFLTTPECDPPWSLQLNLLIIMNVSLPKIDPQHLALRCRMLLAPRADVHAG